MTPPIYPWRPKHMRSPHSGPRMSGFWSKLIPSWRMAVMNGSGERDGWATRSSAQPLRFQWQRCWGLSYFCGRKNVALYSSSGDSRRGVGRAAVLTDLRQKDTRRKSANRDDGVELWSREAGFLTSIASSLGYRLPVWESLQSCANIWWGRFCVCH